MLISGKSPCQPASSKTKWELSGPLETNKIYSTISVHDSQKLYVAINF